MTAKARTAAKYWEGWMLIIGGLGIGLALWLAPAVGASSRDGESLAKRDFNSVVQAISGRYNMHAKAVPMMWLANVCASRVTHGGVRGMRVMEFEDAGHIKKDSADPADLGDLVRVQLGDRWSPMVRERDKKDVTYVYLQNGTEGDLARLIIVDLDGPELDVVGISLKPDQLKKWLDEHNADRKTSVD